MGQPFGTFGTNIGLSYQYGAQKSIAQANARIMRAKGDAAKSQYEARALRTEADNRLHTEKAARQQAEVMRQGTLARGAAIARQGASGFTEEGTGSQLEKSVLQQAIDKANAIGYADSLDDAQLRYQASMLRVSGDIAEMGYDAQASYLDAQANMYGVMQRNANRAANVGGLATGIGMALEAFGVKGASQFGSAIGDIYGAGQLGSAQNLQGMSTGTNMLIGYYGEELWDRNTSKLKGWLQL